MELPAALGASSFRKSFLLDFLPPCSAPHPRPSSSSLRQSILLIVAIQLRWLRLPCPKERRYLRLRLYPMKRPLAGSRFRPLSYLSPLRGRLQRWALHI